MMYLNIMKRETASAISAGGEVSARRRTGLFVAISATMCIFPVLLHAASSNIGFSGHVSRDIGAGLSPLSAETVSFTTEAGLQLIVSNPDSRRSQMRLGVYDSQFRRLDAETFPASVSLEAGAAEMITVIVPFAGNRSRALNICAERITSDGASQRQVCGRYTIRRALLD